MPSLMPIRQHIIGALLGALSLVLLLNGCGTGNGWAAISSPGTDTGGAVRIATDHASYAANAVIHVTVSNRTTAPIYAYDTQASCSILSLAMRQPDGSFAGTNVTRCPLGRPALPVAIAPGGAYTSAIQAGYPGLALHAFPPGIYRLALIYGPSAAAVRQGNGTTLYSATLTIAG